MFTFMKKSTNFMFYLDFFLKCKTELKERNDSSM